MKKITIVAAAVLFFTSCQKEISDTTITPGGGGGNSNGNLLVKGISITGTDTTIINFQWDSNNRLIQYKTSGRTNGIATDSRIDITRATNGNVTKVFSLPIGASGFIDSTVTYPVYQTGSSKLLYAVTTNYSSFLGNMMDSILYTYNTAGKVSSKETYSENFLTGVMEKSSKDDYTYDAQGNMLSDIMSTPGTGGAYSQTASVTFSYDSHLSCVTVDEVAFIAPQIDAETTAINNLVQKVQTASGSTLTGTFSQEQFNSYNRPTSGQISLTPVPPGYTLKFTYYYQ